MSTQSTQGAQGASASELGFLEAELGEWQEWRARRGAQLTAPYGPLSPAGTHWLAEHPDGLLPDIPGRRRPAGGGVPLTRAVGLTVHGRPTRGRRCPAPTAPARPGRASLSDGAASRYCGAKGSGR